MMRNINNTLLPDRSQPGITMIAATVRHPDVGDTYASDVPKIEKLEELQGRISLLEHKI